MLFRLGDVEGLMNICLPYTTLEPVMDKLNTKYWFSTMKEKDSNSYEAAIENIIDNALIPMKAVLGTSKINVQDFVNLQLGDVIRLDRKERPPSNPEYNTLESPTSGSPNLLYEEMVHTLSTLANTRAFSIFTGFSTFFGNVYPI